MPHSTYFSYVPPQQLAGRKLCEMALNSNWCTKYCEHAESLLSRAVDLISICAYRNEDNLAVDDRTPTNHWAIFLRIGANESVMMDMLPGYGDEDTRGNVVITYKKYEFTKNAAKTLRFELKTERTVGEFVDVINNRGRDRYNFTSYEEGCHYWYSIVIGDWEDEDLLPEGSSDEAREALSRYWKDPSGSEERPMAQGTFRD